MSAAYVRKCGWWVGERECGRVAHKLEREKAGHLWGLFDIPEAWFVLWISGRQDGWTTRIKGKRWERERQQQLSTMPPTGGVRDRGARNRETWQATHVESF